MKIGFAGMTHLGLYSAVAAMEKGFEVATSGFKGCDFVYITLDIEEDENDNIYPQFISDLVQEVSDELHDCNIPIIIMSQVPPGFCRKIDRDNIFFQVDTLRIKDALDRALRPEQIVIGAPFNPKEIPLSLRKYWSSFECPVFMTNYESAEMVQKAININLAAQVSVTNTLEEICEVVGAVWEDVARALRHDKRIGPHAYLVPGNGLSSSHLRRDIQTIRKIGEKHGINTDVVRSFIEHSKYRKAKT